MKKYFLLILTIAILSFFAAEIAGAAVANPPPGAQKRKIIRPQAIYPSTPVDVVNYVQPPSKVKKKNATSSPSPTPSAVASKTTEEVPVKAPKKHAQGVAILLVVLIAAIVLGSGGIFIFKKMRSAKERDF